MIMCIVAQVAAAQSLLQGTVVDKETGEPIIGATIADGDTGRPLTITDADGHFKLPNNKYKSLRFSYIGYRPAVGRPADGATFALQAEVSQLGEVVVTAQESRGLTSASVIEKHAMEHLQPSSFADLLELLPGGMSQDPVLNTPNTIRLREANPLGSNYDTSSLGTSFVVDGAPISTNANMQTLKGTSESVADNRDFTNAGVDMRTLPTDDIERVEIVRGIPSVEYGDLTSGLVKIERRRGGNNWQARLKSDMSSKLFYVARAMEWNNHTTLNVSADYLDSKADPRNTLNNYSRLTLSARLGKTWKGSLYDVVLQTNADYSGSFDDVKQDPDLNYGAVDLYKSDYNRMALLAKVELKMKRKAWLKNLQLTVSGAYEHNLISRTRTVTLQDMTGAVCWNDEGEHDAVILPYTYVASQEADGKPLNVFAKLSGRLQVPSSHVANTMLVGIDWNMDKNYGRGQVFDPQRPVYPTSMVRMRSLTLKPASHVLSLFAEETVTLPVGQHKLEMNAGVRASQRLNLPSDYRMSGRVYADPRVNIGWTLPRFRMLGRPSFLRLAAGMGQHTKMPTIDQLFPDPTYIDLLQLKYYHTNEQYRRINRQTYVLDAANPTLDAARNWKWEVSADLNIGGNRLSVTWFRENMTSGFRNQTHYGAFAYKRYDVAAIDGSALTAPPSLDELPYETVIELSAYTQYENGSQTRKQGIEYTFASQRWEAIHTRLTITGAWFRTVYRNSQLIMERPSVSVAGRRLQYVGLYHDDDVSTRETASTNFTFDTDVPSLKLGFSLSAQCMWFSSSQYAPVSTTPDAYMDPDGNIKEWTDECSNDAYLKWLIRTANSSAKNTVPFAMNLNFKVTKKLLADRLNIAMFCNRIWSVAPDYQSFGKTVRRHVKPYFGLEANIKI